MRDLISKFDNIVKSHIKKIKNTIFILSGLCDYIDFNDYVEHIADPATFDKEGSSDYFSKGWFGKIFSTINSADDYLILSHQQYAYIVEYLNIDFFKDRAVVVYDNLRTLYPLAKEDYSEQTSGDRMDERSEDMPVYQTEQFKIGDNYFYSVKLHNESVKLIPFFTEEMELEVSNFKYSNEEVVDISTNQYAIDDFINQCILKKNFNCKFVIKSYAKQPLNARINSMLKSANWLLTVNGGGIYLKHEESIKKEYTASSDSLRLLKKYWGESATFRDIMVYENPDYSNATIPVSQGLLVDTIINEYKIGSENKLPRDIFITAPTGAGKSLIFQLPAFYVAEQGDLTIVVSPLKALMTDQVVNLQRERHYPNVAFINGDLNYIDREKIIRDVKDGFINILYLAPESLLSYNIDYFTNGRRIGLLIIDEAHLITTWGRDFRVDYWFLGNHLNRIRKFSNCTFPIVALTATAVYGGTNDMVFDSISSLYMHDPHKFIGEVVRNDIEFAIDTHDDYSSGNYDKNKEEETVNFIKGMDEIDCKTIVYAPFRRHIDKILQKAEAVKRGMAVNFHGGMSSDSQKAAYESFRTNQQKIMICTKAFGMGIDIPDIQCVYHHAPSGLLPDYIQEIGRAARKPGIKGFAAVTFSPADLRYSKQLFGISSLKTYQLQAVLKKIYNYFILNDKKRNMLISANDFAYVFNSNDEVDQKVLTALMMIEKDYLAKYRFNVLVARPKSLFSQVYARLTTMSLNRLKDLYADCFAELNWTYGDYHFIQLNLDKIWQRHFSDLSFPRLKKDFYDQKFLNDQSIELTPLLKMSFFLDKSYKETLSIFERILKDLSSAVSEIHTSFSFFTEKDFREKLEARFGKSDNVDKLASFILGSYSGRLISAGHIEGDAFLQRRRVGFVEEYQVYNSNYEAKFAQLRKTFAKLFSEDKREVTHYISIREKSLPNYMRIGALLDLLNIGSFISSGGEDPKIFIRINDPRKVNSDANDPKYSNSILESVKDRHKSSCALFEHFFTHYFENKSRWGLIEDFFLGTSLDDILAKYPGSIRNRINLVSYIKDNLSQVEHAVTDANAAQFANEFLPRKDGYYTRDNLLTIESRTKKISKWLTEDPVMLHRAMVTHKFILEKEYYKILMNRLQNRHKDYYRDFMGLSLHIDFPGYDSPVQAKIALENNPVAFYKWYCKNPNVVTLSGLEFKKLILKVEYIKPTALLKKHRNLI